MSLDYINLYPQIDMLVESTISRHRQAERIIPNLINTVRQLNTVSSEMLNQRLELANEFWPAAIPTHEMVQATFAPPKSHSMFNVFATDGSQIHPDRHSSAYYFLINIGLFSLRHGSGASPQVSNQVKICFEEEDLFDQFGSLISPSIINAQRDVLELESLASLAEHSQRFPSLALLDNGLLLWIAGQGGDPRSEEIEEFLNQYLNQLTRIQNSKASIAGFIDRPRHWNVVALIALVSTSLEEIGGLSMKSNPFRGISDRMLYKRLLKPGYRSSLFLQRSKLNTTFKAAGHEIYFFYLNTGGGNNIVRVEVPEWVAKSQAHMELVHDGLLQQCKHTVGYPYALVRAHELAVVSNADRKHFEALVQSRLIDSEIFTTRSQKAETKRWTQMKRRHRL